MPTFLAACSLLPGPTPVPSGGVLYRDDFSNPDSGWDKEDTSEKLVGYKDGQYRIVVVKPNFNVWAGPPDTFSDGFVDVEAANNGGTEDNSFGIICRYDEKPQNPSLYFLIISTDGYYAIGKVKEGQDQLLSSNAMEYSEAIHRRGESNRLRAECNGNRLTLWANEAQLAQVTDDDFSSGSVGLIAGTFDTPGTDVLFDNFVVTKP